MHRNANFTSYVLRKGRWIALLLLRCRRLQVSVLIYLRISIFIHRAPRRCIVQIVYFSRYRSSHLFRSDTAAAQRWHRLENCDVFRVVCVRKAEADDIGIQSGFTSFRLTRNGIYSHGKNVGVMAIDFKMNISRWLHIEFMVWFISTGFFESNVVDRNIVNSRVRRNHFYETPQRRFQAPFTSCHNVSTLNVNMRSMPKPTAKMSKHQQATEQLLCIKITEFTHS